MAALQEAGAEVHAVSEAWRRREGSRAVRGRPTSPLDRLPDALGPTAAEASDLSDAASDAASAALGMGDVDFDFHGHVRRRMAGYRGATGKPVRAQDPRQPLAHADYRVMAARRRLRPAMWTWGLSAVAAGAHGGGDQRV